MNQKDNLVFLEKTRQIAPLFAILSKKVGDFLKGRETSRI